MNRKTILLIIEVSNSNPNGDPDNGGLPRQDAQTERGLISPVSIKRKLRDMVEAKDRPAWEEIAKSLGIADRVDEFQILERAECKVESTRLELKELLRRYWDARVFGAMALAESNKDGEEGSTKVVGKKKKKTEGASDHKIEGPIKVGLGESICPINIHEMTITGAAAVQEGKDRAMAPGAYAVVAHGVYAVPAAINGSTGATCCDAATEIDIKLALALLPHIYSQRMSLVRSDVRLRRAWVVEHKSPLGSAPDWAIWEALRPRRKGNDPDAPSQSWNDYDVPGGLPDGLAKRVESCRDLIEDLYGSEAVAPTGR